MTRPEDRPQGGRVTFTFEEARLATDLDRALDRIGHSRRLGRGDQPSEPEIGPLLEIAELLMLRAEAARQLVSG